MNDMKLVSLKCPNCSGALEIGPSIDTFACGYCGANVQVERGGNIVALMLLTDAMIGVQRGTDRTAAELAIRRLSEEISILQREKDECIAARRGIESKWVRELTPTAASDSIAPLGAAAIAAFVVITSFLSQFSWINATVMMLLAIVASIASVSAGWRVLRKRQLNRHAVKREIRDREISPLISVEHDLLRRLQVLKNRLQAQRQVVDS